MKTKVIAGLILLLGVVFLINSCEKNQGELPSGLVASCDTAKLTYTNQMKAIIDVQCSTNNVSCHGSGAKWDYTTYAKMSSQVSGGTGSFFYQYLFVNADRMPKSPQAGWDPNCMLPKFKAWLLAGAPQ